MTIRLGILHPGEMGSSIAASARNTLGAAYWCSEGRSAATHKRAEQQQLHEIPTLREFCSACELIVAVCPPHAAHEQAQAVIAAGFKGIYVEANALAPQNVQALGAEMTRAGITFIDGGIIGLPAWQPRGTWLYLSGPHTEKVVACFSKGPLETAVLGTEIGQASAFKMCFAAWNKGKTALLASILGAAEAHGVRAALEQQWDIFNPGFTAQSHERIASVARKAWRFSGEMREIAATLEQSGLPAGFFESAAEIYARQRSFKDIAEPPAIEEILRMLKTES